jgi:hypothetical protein
MLVEIRADECGWGLIDTTVSTVNGQRVIPGMTTNVVPDPTRRAPSASCEDTLEQTFGKPGPD